MDAIDILCSDLKTIRQEYGLIISRYRDFVKNIERLTSHNDPDFEDLEMHVNNDNSITITFLGKVMLLRYSFSYDENMPGNITCSIKTSKDDYTTLHTFNFNGQGQTDITPREDGTHYSINNNQDAANILLYWMKMSLVKNLSKA
jgi:hypothetical protein